MSEKVILEFLNTFVPFALNIVILIVIFKAFQGKLGKFKENKQAFIQAQSIQDRSKAFLGPIFKYLFTVYIVVIFGSAFIAMIGDSYGDEIGEYFLENPDSAFAFAFGAFLFMIAVSIFWGKHKGNNQEKQQNQLLIGILMRTSKTPAVVEEMQKFKRIKELKKLENIDNQLDLLAIFKDDSEHWYRAHTQGKGTNRQITSLSRYS